MLRYLLGLIYYSNTIFGNISGKNEVLRTLRNHDDDGNGNVKKQ